jgi:hypothetical protein
MAATNTVYTEAQVEAMLDDTVRNPVTDEDGGEVQITLTFRGVDVNPGAIMDALKNLGTVGSDFIPARQNYNFVISA